MYQRTLNLPQLLNKKSHFLFGARQTGKTTLVEQQLPMAQVIDLLDSDYFQTLLARPKALSEILDKKKPLVVIDEIQKLPTLLDEVQRLMRTDTWTFLLMGSSARKLKRGGANLLAGRAHRAELLPLTSQEIDEFDLKRYLNRGGLPSIYDSNNPHDELLEYVDLYLREEVLAESLVRDLKPFARCLDVLGKSNGCEINQTNIAEDCGISGKTVANYISILNDTLVGFCLPAYSLSKKRKPITRSKFFIFDIGVARYLSGHTQVDEGTDIFGKLFEHFIINEVRAYLSYTKTRVPLSYWRSISGFEVDLILDSEYAIEIKATDRIRDKHFKGLKALREEGLHKKFILISLDPIERCFENWCDALNYQTFINRLWNGEFTI